MSEVADELQRLFDDGCPNGTEPLAEDGMGRETRPQPAGPFAPVRWPVGKVFRAEPDTADEYAACPECGWAMEAARRSTAADRHVVEYTSACGAAVDLTVGVRVEVPVGWAKAVQTAPCTHPLV